MKHYPYINALADDKDILLYRKKLRYLCGTVSATILFSQLLYWFKKNDFDPFYKFITPDVKNSLYKEGESWVEELGFSYKEFANAFDHIGARHKSKTLYEAAENEFVNKKEKEMMFSLYQEKTTGKTWFNINLELVENKLVTIYEGGDTGFTKGKTRDLPSVKHMNDKSANTGFTKGRTDYKEQYNTTEIRGEQTTFPKGKVEKKLNVNSLENNLAWKKLRSGVYRKRLLEFYDNRVGDMELPALAAELVERALKSIFSNNTAYLRDEHEFLPDDFELADNPLFLNAIVEDMPIGELRSMPKGKLKGQLVKEVADAAAAYLIKHLNTRK